ncbi:DegT/DnrJ/EryC1/StrS family aminotransferase [Lapillicoccus jejuensis]|uniref:dTDP-4-amino-4,6-dideoxygalactose transaminase n=1 Tax=Lapillicoccus jejuensis TaxID=402171 RepID=A0A542E1E0_9MICO|nr:DegT/DnrJ/EryC1/StrS family aminotransferase [Lapillicoccus jejuensis]TQJ09163.1 dTDP-4-amino-4,6-dideoxygalactose transaminase [Lapillicoccus jejuensis]
MTQDRIPLVDLRAQVAELGEELETDLLQVLRSAGFVGGPHVAAFEEEYAAFTGARFCVGVANGTDAVELALRGAGVGPGDEVVVPANTFIATAEAVARIGARTVLVDVRPDTLLVDPAELEAALTDRTRAIVPVHLFGQLADLDEMREVADAHGLAVVEDAAQSQGASRGGRGSGSLGHVGATSFYPGKNLGAAGDAGAVTTDDPEIARVVRLMSNHGSPSKYVHDVVGMNSRLDALQAVVLRHKLRRLAAWNARRRAIADRYGALLADLALELPRAAEREAHVWHLYVVQVDRRDEVLRHLQDAGVDAGIHYPVPVHLTEAFRHLGHKPGDFPVAEAAAERILSLPMYPHLSEQQQDRVVEVLATAPGLTGADRG